MRARRASPKSFAAELPKLAASATPPSGKRRSRSRARITRSTDGDVVIAAITSCTNTSNPSVMLGAGLLARNAVKRGLKVKPWVKTSLAPGSQVVTDYLRRRGPAGAISTSSASSSSAMAAPPASAIPGRCPMPIAEAIDEGDLVAAAVLSGNRNFEGRIHPQVRANYLASPPLVVAYALAGSMNVDLTRDPLGNDRTASRSICRTSGRRTRRSPRRSRKAVDAPMFRKRYGNVFEGPEDWKKVEARRRADLRLGSGLDLCREPALFRRHAEGAGARSPTSRGARVLAHLRRQHHHRPHLARRLDQEGQPGRRISARAPGAAGGFQLLRRAARQSRSDDARHLRQYPHQERDGAGRRRRHDQAPCPTAR